MFLGSSRVKHVFTERAALLHSRILSKGKLRSGSDWMIWFQLGFGCTIGKKSITKRRKWTAYESAVVSLFPTTDVSTYYQILTVVVGLNCWELMLQSPCKLFGVWPTFFPYVLGLLHFFFNKLSYCGELPCLWSKERLRVILFPDLNFFFSGDEVILLHWF